MAAPANPLPAGPDLRARALALPRPCLEVLRILQDAGHGAWICGGTARDLVAGVVPSDLDLCTSALPAEARKVLPERWVGRNQPGEDFGNLDIDVEGSALELTTLRREGSYLDGRKPSRVEFTREVEEDHIRRDFTVNAMYLDPLRGTLIDPGCGRGDVAQGRLSCIGEAEPRFREDALRILRALRLCAEHGFVMDEATWRGLQASVPALDGLSGPRIRAELERLLCAPLRARGLMMLVASGAAGRLVPGLAELGAVPQPLPHHPEGDALRHTALVLAHLREPVDPRLAWAALFHDLGKRECFSVGADRIRFDGHDTLSADRAREWLREHGASSELAAEVGEIVAEHIRIVSVPSFRPAKRNRFLSGPIFLLHHEFHRADCLACHRQLGIYETLREQREALPPDLPAPLLRGRDLVELGVPPGPRIGRLLAAVEEARFAGEVRTIEEARDLVQELLAKAQSE